MNVPPWQTRAELASPSFVNPSSHRVGGSVVTWSGGDRRATKECRLLRQLAVETPAGCVEGGVKLMSKLRVESVGVPLSRSVRRRIRRLIWQRCGSDVELFRQLARVES